MIDFRYHLVSLISVFLALAVGIVLGAGPLKEAIGDTLTGEVDQLRSSAADLRTELDQAQADLGESEDAFAAAAPGLLADTLDGRNIAIVELGGAPDRDVQDVEERLVAAGATVTATVHLTNDWTDPARAEYRRALAGSLVEYLDPTPPADAGTSLELAEALMQGLTTADVAQPEALAEQAGVLLQLLAEGGLLDAPDEVASPADAVVVVVGPEGDPPEADPTVEATTEPSEDELALFRDVEEAVVDLAGAADDRSQGVVVAGYGLADDGVLRRLRDDDSTRRAVSTVAYVQSLVGEVSVPLALAENMAGRAGHYGPDGDATAPVPPRVVLPPEEPVITPDDPSGESTAQPTTTPTPGATEGTQG